MKLSDELELWLKSEGDRTVGGLVSVFAERSFAILFVLLLAVPALPLPTGGATHVFELIAILVAVQLVAGRDQIWLPKRWGRVQLVGDRRERFLRGLLKLIRWLERISRPRLAFLFGGRTRNAVFGLLVILGSAAAFLAPPFTGLDTLPALGVVLLSLLVAPEPDRQQPHEVDEVYVVLEGRGRLDVEGESVDLAEGQAIFVPAHANHRFTGYENLSVLVIFAGSASPTNGLSFDPTPGPGDSEGGDIYAP